MIELIKRPLFKYIIYKIPKLTEPVVTPYNKLRSS